MGEGVLVFGSTGTLGSIVAAVLRESGRATVHESQREDASRPLYFDAEDPACEPESLLRATGAGLAINCIAALRSEIRENDPGSLETARHLNVELPRRLARAAGAVGARLLHISTDAVFPEDAADCDESTEPAPNDVYGRTKLEGEPRSEASALTIRISFVGPDARGRGLLEGARRQPAGTKPQGYANHRWNGCTSLQFARLCGRLLNPSVFEGARAESPVHHFCPNETTTKLALLCSIQDCYELPLAFQETQAPRPVMRALATRLRSLPAITSPVGRITDALKELKDYEAAAAATASRRTL